MRREVQNPEEGVERADSTVVFAGREKVRIPKRELKVEEKNGSSNYLESAESRRGS